MCLQAYLGALILALRVSSCECVRQELGQSKSRLGLKKIMYCCCIGRIWNSFTNVWCKLFKGYSGEGLWPIPFIIRPMIKHQVVVPLIMPANIPIELKFVQGSSAHLNLPTSSLPCLIVLQIHLFYLQFIPRGCLLEGSLVCSRVTCFPSLLL